VIVRVLARALLAAALLPCAGGLPAEEREAIAWSDPAIRPFAVGVNASSERAFPAPLHGQPGDFARTTSRLGLRAQPWRSERGEVVVTVGAGIAVLETDARFPRTGPMPDRLYDLRVGGMYRHVSADGAVAGAGVGLGSSSDHPFDDAAGLALSASVFARIPVRSDDAWLLSISYSNRRAVLNGVPIPGVCYLWMPQPSTRVYIGFPISGVMWRPSPRLGAELLLSGLGGGRAGAYVHPSERVALLRLQAALEYGGDVFRRADPQDRSDQIIFREARATAGVGLDAGPRFGVAVYAGYAFARRIVEGRSLTSSDDRIDIAPGALVGATARASW
jgi:hypothetical protein